MSTSSGPAGEVLLNNGNKMPAFGFGTYACNGNEGSLAVKYAIDAGYRLFDTAYLYGNEQEVGEAIKSKINDGVVKREEIFYSTKLWCTFHESDKVERICRESLKNSGLEYIDMYLMHFPVAFVHHSDQNVWPKNPDKTQEVNDNVDYVETWKAMEKLVALGLVKNIGVSNFNRKQLLRLVSMTDIKPVVNQVEFNPAVNQQLLLKECQQLGIQIMAYCPLGKPNFEKKSPSFIFDSKVVEISKRHGKTSAQIVLKFLVQEGVIPIPKSGNKQRIEENINIFDFNLTGDEIDIMRSFNTNDRLVKLSDAKHSIYWPFGEE